MFSPTDIDEEDETYLIRILTLQNAYFGPFPTSFTELDVDLTTEYLDALERFVTRQGGRKRYRNTLAFHMSKETVRFVDKIMKLDPRDRPTAQELLQDQWLSGVVD